jgi:ubiquinone/menaquinone biosynthesis C-methylase UbiE
MGGITKEGGYGDFGSVVSNYSVSRRGYPQALFDFIREYSTDASSILDIGCGTGISTRQLYDNFPDTTVVGIDKSENMLAEARKSSPLSIRYQVASAEDIPFESGTFSIVTAIGSFHWFANERALSEIRRVLRPGGLFFVVNKPSTFAVDLRNIMRDRLGVEIANVKKEYDPTSILKSYGFSQIEERGFETEEKFTLDEAMGIYSSMTISNAVPLNLREQASMLAHEYFSGKINKENGLLERPSQTHLVVGVNSSET